MKKWPLKVWWTRRRSRVQPKEQSQGAYAGNGKCCEFNAYIGGTETDRGIKLDGVKKVILPCLEKGEDGRSANMTMRLEFDSAENAAEALKPGREWRRVEIRAAVICLNAKGGYCFHKHQYIMDARIAKFEQAPIERGGGTAVSAVFDVRFYSTNVNDEKMWEIKADEQQQ